MLHTKDDRATAQVDTGSGTLPATRDAGPGRNPGMSLDLSMFEGHAVNRSAAERRAATLGTRRAIKNSTRPRGS